MGFVAGMGAWFGGWRLLFWFIDWASWPEFPSCLCGASGTENYDSVGFGEDNGWTIKGSNTGGRIYQCLQCNRRFLQVRLKPERFLEIAPDDSLRPYMRKAFRRWEPDDAPAPSIVKPAPPTDVIWPPLPQSNGADK